MKRIARTLAIETSCDETSVAVVEGTKVLANIVYSQVNEHEPFGGVVPEIAARCHLESLPLLTEEALKAAGGGMESVERIAVTAGPGLIGSLLVGVSFAEGLSLAHGLAPIGVNHLEGHIHAARIEAPDLTPPFLALLVSGGHTELDLIRDWDTIFSLGRTLDDAAGEAFDKAARMLGLGYPGGPAIDEAAEGGNPRAVEFPRPMLGRPEPAFSFSGLKTALRYFIRDNPGLSASDISDTAASFREAVVETLVGKARQLIRRVDAKTLVLAGGVAANKRLREEAARICAVEGIRFIATPIEYCTDNAAMIGIASYHAGSGYTPGPAGGLAADASWELPGMPAEDW